MKKAAPKMCNKCGKPKKKSCSRCGAGRKYKK